MDLLMLGTAPDLVNSAVCLGSVVICTQVREHTGEYTAIG